MDNNQTSATAGELPKTFTYRPWRHGGWYVDNVQYASGAVGCVSRNYPDRKWRVVCHPLGDEYGPTFKSRDDAARAEWLLANPPAVAAPAPVHNQHEGQVVSMIDRIQVRSVANSARTYNAMILVIGELRFRHDLVDGTGGDRALRILAELARKSGIQIECHEPPLQQRLLRQQQQPA